MGCLENKFDHVCLVEMSCLHRLNISFFFFERANICDGKVCTNIVHFHFQYPGCQ